MKKLIAILIFTVVATFAMAQKQNVPVTFLEYTVQRPVKSDFIISYIFATDPEKTKCTYKIVAGNNKRYFRTDKNKGGIIVDNAMALNKYPAVYTLVWHAYDATGLYAIANITLYFK